MDDLVREKLLCVLRNNMDKIKQVSGKADYIEAGEIAIKLFNEPIYKTINIKEELVIKPKYFWQKPKTKKFTRPDRVFDYYTWQVVCDGYETTLTKEEYEELLKLKKEKEQEKILNNLEKLCKNK